MRSVPLVEIVGTAYIVVGQRWGPGCGGDKGTASSEFLKIDFTL
jgi:hypothetical protein